MTLSTLGFDANRIAHFADQMFDLSESKMSKPRVQAGWSRKEILGHLIDSASVNHQRIVESQLNDTIVFVGYKHQEWVKLGGYQETDWEELVTLWSAYNMQICTLVEKIPTEVIDKLHQEHSYERTAFRELPSSESSSLGYLIEDYFAHLQYHLDQIFD